MTTTQKNELHEIKKLFDDRGFASAISKGYVMFQKPDGTGVRVCTMPMAQHLVTKH